jgi:hypothetical protein
MLRYVNDGVTTIKPGHETTGNALVKWSDESSFTLFPASGRIFVWRTPKEAYNSSMPGSVPTVERGGGSVIVWAESWYNILLVPLLHFTAELLQESVQAGWVIRCIPCSRRYFRITMLFFEDDNVPIHTAGTVQSWFGEHESELQHLPWPAQPSDLNIIDPLWSVFETRVRNRFPPPTFLKHLEDVLQEEWYKIPLETVQNLYEPIPRMTAAVRIEGKRWSSTMLIKKCVHYL